MDAICSPDQPEYLAILRQHRRNRGIFRCPARVRWYNFLPARQLQPAMTCMSCSTPRRATGCQLDQCSRSGRVPLGAGNPNFWHHQKLRLPACHIPRMTSRTASNHPVVLGPTLGCPRVDLERRQTHGCECSSPKVLFFGCFVAVTVLPRVTTARPSRDPQTLPGSPRGVNRTPSNSQPVALCGCRVSGLDLGTPSGDFPTSVKRHSTVLLEQGYPRRPQGGLPDLGTLSRAPLHHPERSSRLQFDSHDEFPTILYVPLTAPSSPAPYRTVTLPEQYM